MNDPDFSETPGWVVPQGRTPSSSPRPSFGHGSCTYDVPDNPDHQDPGRTSDRRVPGHFERVEDRDEQRDEEGQGRGTGRKVTRRARNRHRGWSTGRQRYPAVAADPGIRLGWKGSAHADPALRSLEGSRLKLPSEHRFHRVTGRGAPPAGAPLSFGGAPTYLPGVSGGVRPLPEPSTPSFPRVSSWMCRLQISTMPPSCSARGTGMGGHMASWWSVTSVQPTRWPSR